MSLKKISIAGVKWTGISAILVTIFQLGQVSILSFYLSPHDFGLMATIMIVIGFSQLFMDMGISNAVIVAKVVNNEQLNSLYWINLFVGIIIYLLLFIAAPIFAMYFDESELTDLIRIIGISFLIQPFGQLYKALIQKNLKFATISIIEVIAKFVAFILSIVLAFNGFGVLSLIYGNLIYAIFLTVMYVYAGLEYHKPKFSLNLNDLSYFINFGLFQLGERVVLFFSTNIDKIIIAKFLGTEILGLYNIAWQIIIMPITKINPIIIRVAFPVFSKISHDKERSNNYYSKAVTLMMLINFPIMFGLFIVSDDLVRIFFSSEYFGAAFIIKILSLYGIIRSFGNPGGAVIYSHGRADLGFYWQLFWLFVFSSGQLFAIKFFNTLEALVYSQVVIILMFGWIWHLIIAKVGHIKYIPLLKNMSKLLLFSIIMMAVVLFFKLTVNINLYMNFALQIIFGVLTYVFLVLFFFMDTVKIFLPESISKRFIK